jgi:hypothetical protein
LRQRNDLLATLRARKQISAEQYRAGRTWQKLHKQAATAALARCYDALGQSGTALLEDVLARGMTVTEAAAARGLGTRRGLEYLGQRLRECLETLAREFGYA